jgi:DNA-binding transcriptional LysR family regulator
LELRQLRQFVAVAEELHFGRAAARLFMSQPPLTVAIQQLERELGVVLFNRDRRSVTLTEAGEAILSPARTLLAEAANLAHVARRSAQGQTGTLRLAFVSSISYNRLPSWIRAFRSEYPDVELQLVEATFDVQMAAFDRGDLDAGFVIHAAGAPPQGFNSIKVVNEPMVLAVPESHSMAANDRVRFESIADDPLIMFPRSIAPSMFDAVINRYHQDNRAPAICQEAIQLQTIVNLVSAGIGIAWVPQSMTALQRPGVVYKKVANSKINAETSLIWRNPDSVLTQHFVEAVTRSLRDKRRSR